jgi:hypothetical protein
MKHYVRSIQEEFYRCVIAHVSGRQERQHVQCVRRCRPARSVETLNAKSLGLAFETGPLIPKQLFNDAKVHQGCRIKGIGFNARADLRSQGLQIAAVERHFEQFGQGHR